MPQLSDPTIIARLAAIEAELSARMDRDRALHFEVALLLDEARGYVAEEQEIREAA